MPNRRVHVQAGAFVGAVAAVVRAKDQPSEFLLVEAAGGVLGGVLGGVMPDVLEPATSPNHRKLAHSVVAGGSLTLAKVAEWQAECRRRAAGHAQLAYGCAPGSRERLDAELAALGWSLLAGFIVGFVAGYASHLALDALTERSLPLGWA